MRPPPGPEPASDLSAAPLRTRTRLLLRDALLPMRAGTPLGRAARWRVALLWAALGALIAGLWSLALVIALGRAALSVAPLIVALVAGGALFFGALGYAMVGVGNRLIAHDQTPRAHGRDTRGPGAR